ncbi:hypothetical protein [Haladaptatus sp. CMAA 1911]|uniref:hypothetical protein n=1 Tax=unclassified Haladaptatus TaxID=2622732 RepID=UPI00375447B2
MTESLNWMRPVDIEILTSLQRIQPEYLPIVANRMGLHLSYAERRCDLLRENGLIAPVTGEAIYQLTSDGETVLADVREGSLTTVRTDDTDEDEESISI